ncbi:MAG: hypothetical protein IJ226_00850 [Clostridia bacterium]|nr:hypothetical protein [Clostridia bacterium]
MFAALVLHEAGHIVVGRLRGYVVKSIVLMPYGAMMSMEENFDKTSGVLIGLAGPLTNFLVALLTFGVWWLFPSLYGVTRTFLFANLSLGLFNLLPVYPLDGSRVALVLCKNKLKGIKVLQIFGVVASIVFFAGFVTSLFFKVNFSLGIMAVFLFSGAAFGVRDETYLHVLSVQSKNYDLGVEKKTVIVSENTPLVRFFHHTSKNVETTFQIVDETGKIIKNVTETDLCKIALKSKLSKTFKEAEKSAF